jgi:hypothetical protein
METVAMTKKSSSTNLALKYLLILAALLKVVNELVDLLSKVVNYEPSLSDVRL